MASWGLREGDEIVPGRSAIDLLGRGLRYETYLAWDEHLRALVVAKVVLPDLVGDPGAMGGLAAEAALLGRLGHPMLLRSFGADLGSERPHLVLEHIEGPRLSSLIRRFGVIVEQLLPLALNLCAALHYLAREGVVHLDVKPSNVIMAGAPRLIDLSVARTFEGLGELRSPVGTDAYMAPEQCEPGRFADIGPPADMWGLGAPTFPVLHDVDVRGRPVPATPRALPNFHSFRHTAASRAIASGESAEEVAWQLGHRNSVVTRAVYIQEIKTADRLAHRRQRAEHAYAELTADL